MTKSTQIGLQLKALRKAANLTQKAKTLTTMKSIAELPKTIIVNKYSKETAVLVLNKGLHGKDFLGYYRDTNKTGRKDECFMIDGNYQDLLRETMEFGEQYAVNSIYQKLKKCNFI
jgi:hypothetical protein